MRGVKSKFVARKIAIDEMGSEWVWYVAARVQDDSEPDAYSAVYYAVDRADATKVAKALSEAFRKSAAFSI